MIGHSNASIPPFESILEASTYGRADQEPVEILRKLYPFKPIDAETLYDFDALMSYFSVAGYRYALPFIVDFFIASPKANFEENLAIGFEHIVSDHEFSHPINAEFRKFIGGLSADERADLTHRLESLLAASLSDQCYPEDIATVEKWIKRVNSEAVT